MAPPPRTTTVRVFRRPPFTAPRGTKPTPLEKPLEVDLEGQRETSDRARVLVRSAVATHANVTARDVLVNHAEGGGFVAYVPASPT